MLVRTDFGALWGACSQKKGKKPASSGGHGSVCPPRHPAPRGHHDGPGGISYFFFPIFKLHIKTLPYLRRVSTGQACRGVRGARSPRAPQEQSPPRPARPCACALNQWLKEKAPTEEREMPEPPTREHRNLHRGHRGTERRPCLRRVSDGDGADGACRGDAWAPTAQAGALNLSLPAQVQRHPC